MIGIAERRELAQLLSAVQADPSPGGVVAAPHYYAHADDPPIVVALTGPPGAGKSTLMNLLACEWADREARVAVLAIDPSSPYSGGAVLGDRIRAPSATSHPGVYFRSVAMRDSLDAMIVRTVDSCAVLRRFGFRRILIETVGAGQMNLEALALADCVVGLSVPGLGDAVQLSKAGFLETADVHVVSKSDVEGAAGLRAGLETMIEIAYPRRDSSAERRSLPGVQALLARHGDPVAERETWRPPVISVRANPPTNVPELAVAVDRYVDWLAATGRRERLRRTRMRTVVAMRLKLGLLAHFGDGGSRSLDGMAGEIAAGRLDPGTAASTLLADIDRRG